MPWEGRGQDARGMPQPGARDVLPRPGHRRVRPGVGGRQGAQEAQRPRHAPDAHRVARRLVPAPGRPDGPHRRVQPRRARHGAGAAGALRARRPGQPPCAGTGGARLRGAPPPRGQDGLPGAGECLADLGDEDAKRRFVGDRLRLVGRRGMAAADGGAGDLPMDPAGLPNSCHLPAAAVSDHNGEASEEREAATSARPGACGTTGHRGQSPERGSVSSMPSCAIASPTRSPRRIPMSRAPIDKIRNSQFEPVTKTIRTPPEVTSLAQAASPRMAVAHEHGRLPTR